MLHLGDFYLFFIFYFNLNMEVSIFLFVPQEHPLKTIHTLPPW